MNNITRPLTLTANGVTPREKEILHLLSHEFTSKEIASKLFISTHTVESHKKNLKRKLSSKNAVGLIRKAFEGGILPLVNFDYRITA